LNWDLFTNLTLSLANTPFLAGYMGVLDGSGGGAAQMNSPPLPPAAVGAVLCHAYCLNAPFDFVSNPVDLVIVP
jgi:hypothetical protein